MLAKNKINNIRKIFGRGDQGIVLVFQALQDLNRFRILKLLRKYRHLCVTDLANCLGITVAAVSQHLKILELSGFVKRERHGKMICYQLKPQTPRHRKIIDFIFNLT